MFSKDPIGKAIRDYHTNNSPEDIIVESDITDEDIIPIDYLFRTYEEFPELEKVAMKHCNGEILDVGAAAGPHTKYLLEQGFSVSTVEVSPNAHAYLKETYPKAKHHLTPILNLTDQSYDTILLMMNGIGLAGTYHEVVPFLKHLSTLLKPGGKILAESTDVIDIFKDEEGGMWVDLNAEYYGSFRFNMKYKGVESGWFDWIYIDKTTLKNLAKEADLSIEILYENQESFLMQLQKL